MNKMLQKISMSVSVVGAALAFFLAHGIPAQWHGTLVSTMIPQEAMTDLASWPIAKTVIVTLLFA
jgi:hypothetical protein